MTQQLSLLLCFATSTPVRGDFGRVISPLPFFLLVSTFSVFSPIHSAPLRVYPARSLEKKEQDTDGPSKMFRDVKKRETRADSIRGATTP